MWDARKIIFSTKRPIAFNISGQIPLYFYFAENKNCLSFLHGIKSTEKAGQLMSCDNK